MEKHTTYYRFLIRSYWLFLLGKNDGERSFGNSLISYLLHRDNGISILWGSRSWKIDIGTKMITDRNWWFVETKRNRNTVCYYSLPPIPFGYKLAGLAIASRTSPLGVPSVHPWLNTVNPLSFLLKGMGEKKNDCFLPLPRASGTLPPHPPREVSPRREGFPIHPTDRDRGMVPISSSQLPKGGVYAFFNKALKA